MNPPLSPLQILELVGLTALAFSLVGGTAVYFIMKNIHENKRRKPTPFIQSIIARYGDIMYDERFAKMPDREFIKLLKDSGWVMLWLVWEANIRLMKKVEKAEEKKP